MEGVEIVGVALFCTEMESQTAGVLIAKIFSKKIIKRKV